LPLPTTVELELELELVLVLVLVLVLELELELELEELSLVPTTPDVDAGIAKTSKASTAFLIEPLVVFFYFCYR
jgi:hypothetical protein